MTDPTDIRKTIVVRLPRPVVTAIDERARKTGHSRNAWMLRALSWALAQPVKTEARTVTTVTDVIEQT